MTEPRDAPHTVVRHARELVGAALEDTPIVVLQGARQVGKSTLAAEMLALAGAPLLNLDETPLLNAARADPDGFVRQRPGLIGIDEVQRAPELIRAMKAAVDQDRRPGRFLITGSANLLAVPGTEESLAGRAETVTLYGLSQGEILGRRESLIERLLSGEREQVLRPCEQLSRHDYLERACLGGYPEPRTRSGRRRTAWFDNYLQRIVSRDAQAISRLPHLDRLPVLVHLLAANSAGELVVARLAHDSEIPERSLPAYLDLLETIFLIQRLPPWGRNLTSRVIERPKVALLDTGLAARLNRITPIGLSPEAWPEAAGSLLETFVASELRKQASWADNHVELYHYRDRNRGEVDIVLDSGDAVAGVEVKAATTIGRKDLQGLIELRDRLGPRFAAGVVLYTGATPLPFGERLYALPISALWA